VWTGVLSARAEHRSRRGVRQHQLGPFDQRRQPRPAQHEQVGRLQHATTGDRPILLRTEGGVGHNIRALSRGVGVTGEFLGFLAELGLSITDEHVALATSSV
jgi:prolyl oligopeptidase